MNKFSPDTLIQAAWTMYNGEEFSQILSDVLYGKIQSKMKKNEWDSFRKLSTLPHISHTSEKKWDSFFYLPDRLFTETTAYDLAKLIARSRDTIYAPTSILSFNAEPLLYSLINSFLSQAYIERKTKHNRDMLQIMTKSTSSFYKDKIPYYFCHGHF